ncbi:MAG: ABC transporter permease [Steroidobacteraceae bacterium]
MLVDVEKWQEIFNTLRQHKLRTALTAFGVFWGIFMLTVMLGAARGLQNGVVDGFPPVPNSIFIWSQGVTQLPYQGMATGRQIKLQAEDLEAIRKNVAGVAMIKGQNSVGLWGGSSPYTVHKSRNGAFAVQGGFAGIEEVQSMRIVEGRSIDTLDEQQRRKVAVIGERVRSQLFLKGESALRANLTINGISFEVIGIFRSRSEGNQQQEEEKIYLPNDTLRYAFNQVGWVGNFVVLPKPGVPARDVEERVKKYLAKRNRVNPDDKGVFGSFNLQNEYDKIQGLFAGMKALSWAIAIGTILAGAIGVGNIMLIVVKERTREIGLRKALGATPGSIVFMIMQESLFITAVAGYTGLVVGTLLLQAVAKLLDAGGGAPGFFSRPEVDFRTAIAALAVLITSGVLASLMPAARAAGVNPIVALQEE